MPVCGCASLILVYDSWTTTHHNFLGAADFYHQKHDAPAGKLKTWSPGKTSEHKIHTASLWKEQSVKFTSDRRQAGLIMQGVAVCCRPDVLQKDRAGQGMVPHTTAKPAIQSFTTPQRYTFYLTHLPSLYNHEAHLSLPAKWYYHGRGMAVPSRLSTSTPKPTLSPRRDSI
ncbi:hypothetical protein E2C01_019070 [Portunus trituberculatus]|uniref:Uncharacterized protein n=1 Tax=Portunus trituberculatus TaxID=210409 RepID=A0A5B7DY19_PORTR|nr:hypothetical protein [Portunus trituberculatus]